MLSLYKTFIQKNLAILIGYVVIVCLISIERVAIPHMYGKLLESLRSAKFDETTKLFAIVVGIFVVFQIFDTLLTYIDAKLMPRFEAFVRRHVVDVIIDRHKQHYKELDLGNITSKLIKLPTNLNTLFYRTKTFLFNHVFSILVAVGYLYFCHPYLGAIFTGAFVLLALFTWAFCRQCSTPSYNRDATFDHMQESIQDILYNLQTVYVHSTVDDERERIDALNDTTVRRVQDWVFCGIPYRIIFAVLFLSVFAGVTWTSLKLYQHKRMSLALLVSSFMVTFAILRTCISFYHDFEDFIYVQGGMQVVSDYLDGLPAGEDEAELEGRRIPQHPRYPTQEGVDIVFDEVSYVPSATAKHALEDGGAEEETASPALFDNFNLRIRAGEHVAIVGGIGTGKTTLAHLLLKLRTPSAGRITFNGASLASLSSKTVREVVHYVPQQPRLFNRTLWENLRYGNPNPKLTPETVYALLRRLKMTDVEAVFRQKMHKSVGKQGSHLSGGQRQTVVLLRAVFNTRAKILVLDEPTSALDATNRDHVLQLVREVAKGRTLLVITHDDALVQQTRRVVRLGEARAS